MFFKSYITTSFLCFLNNIFSYSFIKMLKKLFYNYFLLFSNNIGNRNQQLGVLYYLNNYKVYLIHELN